MRASDPDAPVPYRRLPIGCRPLGGKKRRDEIDRWGEDLRLVALVDPIEAQHGHDQSHRDG